MLPPQLQHDFRNFLYALWKYLQLPSPTPIQYDIAHFVQHGPKRRMVMAARGVGKSWITYAYGLWSLAVDPEDERVLIVSANADKAIEGSTFVQRLIQSWDLLSYLRPRDNQRYAVTGFDVGPSKPHPAPSLRAVGIGGQLTGGRARKIIADDVEIPKNSLTQIMRDRLAEQVKEFDALIYPDVGEIIYLGTPQSEQTLYLQLPDRGYSVRVWPARYPRDVARYGDRLAPFITDALSAQPTIAGTPTEPLRFGEQDLQERELSYGRSGFAMQFMLDPSVGDGDRYPLKLRDLLVMSLDSEAAPARVIHGSDPNRVAQDIPAVGLQGDRWYRPAFISDGDYMPYQGVVMAIDPAGRGGDELAFAVVAQLNAYLYVLDCQGLKGGYSEENLKHLALQAKRWKVKHIVVEENFGDGMFSKLLEPQLAAAEYPCVIEEVKHSIQKERRIIDTLEPVVSTHRLIINESLARRDLENYNGYPLETAHRYQLFHQFTRITKDRGSLAKDDRLDVLAIAVGYFVEAMSRNVAKLAEERLDALRHQDYLKFMRSAGLSNKLPKANYMATTLGHVRSRGR